MVPVFILAIVIVDLEIDDIQQLTITEMKKLELLIIRIILSKDLDCHSLHVDN